MVRELQQVLETLAADRMLVLVLEDLHWGDVGTVSALGGIAMRREPAHLLVIATYRPVDAVAELHPIVHLKHELTARRQCTEIALDGLEVDEVVAYSRQVAGPGFPASPHRSGIGRARRTHRDRPPCASPLSRTARLAHRSPDTGGSSLRPGPADCRRAGE